MVNKIKQPIINEELAYLCGVFAGDGSMGIRIEKHEYSLKCVGNPKDEKEFYLEIIKPMFKRVFGLDINTRLYDGNTTFGFRIHSKELILYLTNEIGLPSGKKYDNLHIPKAFLLDANLTKAFVRGVFDTDGCVSFKKRYRSFPNYPVISVSSKNSEFINEIQFFLKNEGFRTSSVMNYKKYDVRFKAGFNLISGLALYGRENLNMWQQKIAFWSPKHIKKIKRNSGE